MEKAVRYSKKREAILEAIRSTECHPSADWVYQTLKPTHPDLSLGTVYRNLDFFRQHGMIISIGVVKGQERFDATTAPHTHFVCNCCGCVIDLEGIQPDAGLDRSVGEKYGLSIDRHELLFHGTCQPCMQNQNPNN